MNISSVIVQVKPDYLEKVIKLIQASRDFEYHVSDDAGKIIVTLEGADTTEELKKLKKLKALPEVISAEMVFAYSEDELELERENLEKTEENIPDWLNDPDARASDIKYNGDLKGKM